MTFDYELFLGDSSGSVSNCMIIPTTKILEILKKFKIKAIFFVDLTYLNRLDNESKKYISVKNDYKEIKDQLLKIKSLGHYIFYHLHPHWLDAKYLCNKNEWDLSEKRKFSLNNLNDKEIHKVFFESKKILKNFKLDRQAKGFRAGGLYIQPFERIKKHFLEFGIKYDFSVLKGSKKSQNQSNRFGFDYTKTPKSHIYNFEDSVVKEDMNGSFKEFSIKFIEIKGWRKVVNGISYRINKNNPFFSSYGDGIASGNKISSNKRKKNYLRSRETISLELLNFIKMNIYYSDIKNNDFQHFISHPKLISPQQPQVL